MEIDGLVHNGYSIFLDSDGVAVANVTFDGDETACIEIRNVPFSSDEWKEVSRKIGNAIKLLTE